MKPEELETLIAGYLAKSLSEDEEKQLLDLLRHSSSARAALGVELAVDRMLRESQNPPLAADRILKALPRASREEFAREVMSRIPAERRWGRLLIPGLIAAGLLAGLIGYASRETRTRVEPKGEGLAIQASGSGSEEPRVLREAEEERTRAQGERRRSESTVAALRQQERAAGLQREQAERERREDARKRADEELEKLKTEREAEEARLVEAFEQERRAARAAARPAEPSSPKAPATARTETIAATIENVEGAVTLLDGQERVPKAASRSLLAGQGLETAPGIGSATLSFADRTRLELGSGTDIREVFDREPPGNGARGRRLVLARGRLTASVTKQPTDQPFVVSTPHGAAKVVGTTLRLSVGLFETRLEVTEGRVLFTGLDGKTVEVPGGHYAIAAAGTTAAPRVILDRLHYEVALLKRPDVLFFEDFEQEAWKRHWSSPSEASRATEERAFTLVGRRALEVRWKAHERAGDGWSRLTLPSGVSRAHLRAYFYFPKDYELGPEGGISLFKLGALPVASGVQEGMSLWADHTPNGRDFFSVDLVLTRRWTLQFGYYHPDQTGPKGDWWEADLAQAVTLKPGRWHSVELLCQSNDPGQKNGALEAWIDGTPCGEVRGIRFRDTDALQIREMALTGGGPPSPRNQSYYVDDVVLAREYIGTAFGDAEGVEPRLKR